MLDVVGGSLGPRGMRRRQGGGAYGLAFDFGADRFTDTAGTVPASNGGAVAAVRSTSGGVLLTQATVAAQPVAAAGSITLAADHLVTADPPQAMLDVMGSAASSWALALQFTLTDVGTTQTLFSAGLSSAAGSTVSYIDIRVQATGVIRANFVDDAGVQSNRTTAANFVAAGVETILWVLMEAGALRMDAYTTGPGGKTATSEGAITNGNRALDRIAVGALRRNGATASTPMTGSFKRMEFWQI